MEIGATGQERNTESLLQEDLWQWQGISLAFRSQSHCESAGYWKVGCHFAICHDLVEAERAGSRTDRLHGVQEKVVAAQSRQQPETTNRSAGPSHAIQSSRVPTGRRPEAMSVLEFES